MKGASTTRGDGRVTGSVGRWDRPANNRASITTRLLVRLYGHPTRILHHPAPPLHSFAVRLPCLTPSSLPPSHCTLTATCATVRYNLRRRP
jgi:hypothetical protein